MRKILIGILISICIILLAIPLFRDKIVDVKIDGNFTEWDNMPYTSYGKEDKSKANIKSVKYYLDDKYLYLYIKRYYMDRKWNVIINIMNNEKNSNIEYDVKRTFQLTETDASDKLNVCSDINNYDDLQYISSKFYNNELEIQIPLELLTINNKVMYLDIFLVQNEHMNLINHQEEYLAITTGTVFGKMGSVVISIICIKIMISFMKNTYYRKKIY